ncbi:MAG: hypothetical protein RBU27_03640 [Bacteroidota bacterium]|jgi:hypothetical protein|nr:hypothetical protein [Bacteroidota bacterium]
MSAWSARAVHDSIVQSYRGPAFLAQAGNIFALHVYPLASGSTRKFMLVFITPTMWLGNTAVAELPLKLLQDNNAEVKPLRSVFNMAENVWGEPTVCECK